MGYLEGAEVADNPIDPSEILDLLASQVEAITVTSTEVQEESIIPIYEVYEVLDRVSLDDAYLNEMADVNELADGIGEAMRVYAVMDPEAKEALDEAAANEFDFYIYNNLPAGLADSYFLEVGKCISIDEHAVDTYNTFDEALAYWKSING